MLQGAVNLNPSETTIKLIQYKQFWTLPSKSKTKRSILSDILMFLMKSFSKCMDSRAGEAIAKAGRCLEALMILLTIFLLLKERPDHPSVVLYST